MTQNVTFDKNKRIDTNPIKKRFVQGENLADEVHFTGPKMLGLLDLSTIQMYLRADNRDYQTSIEFPLKTITNNETVTIVWTVDERITQTPGITDLTLIGRSGSNEVIKITSDGVIIEGNEAQGGMPPINTWESILNKMWQYCQSSKASETAAAASAKTATDKATAADTSAKAAKTSETNAASSKTAAATSAANAKASETNAAASKTAAAASAKTATDKATAADASAKAAKTSETNAASSATNAKASETNAATSKTAAAASAKTATDKATAADTSAKAAKTSEANAASSAATAVQKATKAGTSAAEAKKAAQEALGFRTMFDSVLPEDGTGDIDPSRPLLAGAGAHVTVKAKGDRIESVTVDGLTTQAGTGDPSPDNVREITGCGLQANLLPNNATSQTISGVTFTVNNNKCITLTGTTTSADVTFILAEGSFTFPDGNILLNNTIELQSGIYLIMDYIDGDTRGSVTLRPNSKSILIDNPANRNWVKFYIKVTGGTVTNSTVYPALNIGAKAAPYTPYNGSEYGTVVQLSGRTDPTHTLLPLTAPIYAGDSVTSKAPSGCDKKVVFDGSMDEIWALNAESHTGPSGSKRFATKIKFPSVNNNNDINGIAYSSYLGAQTPNNTYKAQYEDTFSVGADNVHLRISGIATVDALRTYLAANPLTVWYKSVDYTMRSDISVSLEIHNSSMLVLDGTENWQWQNSAGSFWRGWLSGQFPFAKTDFCICSHALPKTSSGSNNGCQMADRSFLLAFPNVQGADKLGEFKSYLAAQYAAGTPVQALYQLTEPVVYAHDTVPLEALPDDSGTFVVSGESTVATWLKPLQDGGNAKTLDGHTWDEIGSGSGTVQSVCGVSPDEEGNVPLTPAAIGAATAAQGTKADTALQPTGNASNTTAAFAQATTRANLATGEKLSVLFGKLAKWFADLKTVAFTGSYADLSNKPTTLKNPSSLTISLNGTSQGAYDGSAAKAINVTAATVGARPSTWTPTAADVGARPSNWTPTAADVGARPSNWTPTAADVGATPKKTYTATYTVAGWAQQSDGTYTQTAACTGMTAAYEIWEIRGQRTSTAAGDAQVADALGAITIAESLAGQVKLTSSSKPAVAYTAVFWGW